MRAFVPEYDLIIPQDLSEALSLLARDAGVWRPIAGGTDLMVQFESGKLSDKNLMSIGNLRELRGIEVSSETILIGAATTYTELRGHAVLQSEFPLLVEAASVTGSIANQNRGTIGGNIVNASPAADSPPALLVYDAELELISERGARTVPYQDFHTGYRTTILRPEELVGSILLSRNTGGLRHYFRKVGTRKAQSISKVCMAATAAMEGPAIKRIRIALGSIAPTAIRCIRAEAALVGQPLDANTIATAKAEVMAEVKPIDDFRSTAAYRRQVAGNLMGEFLRTLSSSAGQN
jgi:CO/xanthine dehydrogenase FAD-binding subunit